MISYCVHESLIWAELGGVSSMWYQLGQLESWGVESSKDSLTTHLGTSAGAVGKSTNTCPLQVAGWPRSRSKCPKRVWHFHDLAWEDIYHFCHDKLVTQVQGEGTLRSQLRSAQVQEFHSYILITHGMECIGVATFGEYNLPSNLTVHGRIHKNLFYLLLV